MMPDPRLPAAAAGAERAPAMVMVWDPFVRIFHWSLVAAFVAAFVTGDWLDRLHEALGYAIAALIAARVVWGLIGPRRARFADFVKPPAQVLAYLRAALAGRAGRCLGHNPAGGLMIVALLVMLALSCLSGWLMTTDAFWGSAIMEEVHEGVVNLTLLLIPLHVAGVVFSSLAHKENLVRAMLTGKKRAAA